MSKPKVHNKWTHERYLEELNKYPLQVIPIEDYIDSQTKIAHKCVKCEAITSIAPNSVLARLKKNGTICQECGGKTFRVGKNDLWTTHPDIANHLVDKELGYTVTSRSEKKFDWICPECGTIVYGKSVNNTVYYGLSCPICSLGRSMGHRITNALFECCGIPYRNEVTFPWSHGKRYDIFANDDCIVEVNGIQHTEDCYLLKMSNKSLEDEQSNDSYKMRIAFENGIEHYIVVDSSKSDYSFIIDGIKHNADLIDYIDKYGNVKFANIDWNFVFDKYNDKIAWKIRDYFNTGLKISEIAEKTSLADVTIQRYLHLLTDYGHCAYDAKAQTRRKVKCITTGECFDSMASAAEKYHIKPLGIYRVCNGLFNRTTAGKLPDGTGLVWEYI